MTYSIAAPLRRTPRVSPRCPVPRRSASVLTAFLALLVVSDIGGARLEAQALRDRLPELFIVSLAPGVLGSYRSADPANPAAGSVTTDVFAPGAQGANGQVLGFLLTWMNGTVASAPLGTTGAGVSFHFDQGTPVESAVSRGPIFGEWGYTIGRGRFVAGLSTNAVRYTSVRGTDMDRIGLNFTSRCAVDAASCTSAEQGTASDVLRMQLGVDLQLTTLSAYATVGVTNWLDVGVVVPGVRADLEGRSSAEVLTLSPTPGAAPTAFLSGTAAAPVRSATRSISGNASGVGDVAARAKVALIRRSTYGIALVGEARFATGDEADFLGSGANSVRGGLTYSARARATTPSITLGYLHWTEGPLNDAVLLTTGVDHVISPRAAVAVAFVSELQTGTSVFQVPSAVGVPTGSGGVGTTPIRPLELPQVRDDAMHASLGGRFTGPWGTGIIANVMVPVRRGGPRPDQVWTLGLERSF